MGNQAYAKPTADGRVWANPDELVGTTFCIPKENRAGEDLLLETVGAFYVDLQEPKSSPVHKTAGWHKAGEAFL
jgi:hypothetical protein